MRAWRGLADSGIVGLGIRLVGFLWEIFFIFLWEIFFIFLWEIFRGFMGLGFRSFNFIYQCSRVRNVGVLGARDRRELCAAQSVGCKCLDSAEMRYVHKRSAAGLVV